MKIGVFDSGVGGLSVVNAINKELPDLEILYREDKKNIPYGDKPIKLLHKLVLPILKDMQNAGCKVIVIACNTVTTNLINGLRSELKVPLIGMEPMVKPAAKQTATGVIAVCATPMTLSSKRYQWLKAQYAKGVKVIEPDCSDWSYMIENNQLDIVKINNVIKDVLSQKTDVVVLGCTHYHWIEEQILMQCKGRARVIQPETAVVKRLKQLLKTL